jgi:UDP-N-acetylmuramyl tripeptide synthase
MRAGCGWRGAILKTVTKHGNHKGPIETLENKLESQKIEIERIHLEPARRLTGPGMLWDRPGAVIDITAGAPDVDRLADLWKQHARAVLDAIGWTDQKLSYRRFQSGINLVISAPVDQLHSAVLVAQVAWHQCACDLLGVSPLPFDDLIGSLTSIMAQEANPRLCALIAAANARDVDILFDDDDVSVGQGICSQTWSLDNLPDPQDMEWSDLHDIPVAMITGTNGKTTTTRLCAAIAHAAGKTAGLTTTDVVQVGDDILDRGDYSGPGGARMLLRDPRVEIAFLEVARGGILRRGLATRRARVAVVTNIAKDHLGEYGVTTLPELADAKFAVTRALLDGGVSVLNADDPIIVEKAASLRSAIWWFSLNSTSPQIKHALRSGQPCAFLDQGALTLCDGTHEPWSVNVGDVPITLQGAARHNIYNVLAAMCACAALNIPKDAIQIGLAAFTSNHNDNPGRFNEFDVNGARIFVDYAHNPHAIAAVCDALAQIPARRRFIMISQPGDRTDQDIIAATTAGLKFQPDHIVVAEISDYLRGRKLNETPDIIGKAALNSGINYEHISYVSSPSEGTDMILQQLKRGDLALLLVLSDRERVFDLLKSSRME